MTLPIYTNIDRKIFQEEIIPSGRPAIIKGLINHWNLTNTTLTKSDVLSLLSKMSTHGEGCVLEVTDSDHRVFYNDDMSGFTFKKHALHFEDFIKKLIDDTDSTYFLQSALADQYFTDFSKNYTHSLLAAEIKPRIWIGNKTVVPTHYDTSDNIACVVMGQRRFTLFPPSQIKNLYLGPLEFTPGGAPVSLVDIHKPDLEKYPNYIYAQKTAITAILDAGDALYIPPLWFHNVEALDDINILVNYWWMENGACDFKHSLAAKDAMLLALLTIKTLPKHQRKNWQHFFEHYIFEEESERVGHIPLERRGVLGRLSKSLFTQLKNHLLAVLKSQ